MNPPADGLSPRVRGNRGGRYEDVAEQRSIPACAGEPPHPGKRQTGRQVYPRVCGGTGCFSARPRAAIGLSPRVRGNPTMLSLECPAARSIPACAGEPLNADSPAR